MSIFFYPKKVNYINYVDGLRAFAVISVLFFHLNCGWFKGGFVGVDVFFVISGFLITRLIIKEIEETNQFNFTNFYCRRVRRIFPALFFVLISCWVAGFFLFSPNHFQSLGKSLSYAAVSLSNIFFWQESGYFSAASEFKPLLHTWSLGVEEQFYLIWPLIILATARFNKRLLPLIIILLGLISLILNFFYQKNHLEALYYLMPFRIFEFCIGALMVWLIPYRFKVRLLDEIICFIGLALMIFAVIYFNSHMVFPSYHALIPTVGAALVIYSGNARCVGLIFSNRISIAIGLISYSLYLVHWPIIVFFSYITSEAITSVFAITMVVFLSVSVAVLMYNFIEQPFRKSIPKDSKAQYVTLIKWTPCIFLTSLLGLTVYYNSGWSWRVPEYGTLSQIKNPEEYHTKYFGGEGFPYPFGWTYKTDDTKPDIVLMGDSYAQMLQYGLVNQIAKPFNKSIYIAGQSCLILPEIYRNTPGYDWKQQCVNVLNEALAKLNEKNDSILILSQSWFFQISYASDSTNDQPLNINLSSANASDYQAFLIKLDKLRKLIGDRKLIIIGDVPGAGSNDTFSCLTRPILSKVNCMSKNNISRNTNTLAINVNTILKGFAKENKNTFFLDPYSVLCDNEVCHSISPKGMPYYSDGHHLSKLGSKFMMAGFRTKLESIISNNILEQG